MHRIEAALLRLLLARKGRCRGCAAPLYGVFRAHHHSENGKDVT